MDFDVIDICIKLQVDDKGGFCSLFPNMGSEFAACCRSVACGTPDLNCDACKKQGSCDWYFVFSQDCAEDSFALKRHQKPALPFAFSFPWHAVATAQNVAGMIELRLSVVGRAISSLEMLLAGFSLLTESGSLAGCVVEEVGSRNLQGDIQPLKNGNLSLLSSAWIIEPSFNRNNHFEIILSSPLKLLSGGKQTSSFDFALFARSVMRRVSSLAYYYGGYEFEADFTDLSRQVATVACIDNNFELTGQNKLSGMMGSGTFEGNLEGILPFLKLGTYVNVGKLSAFGMGCFKLN